MKEDKLLALSLFNPGDWGEPENVTQLIDEQMCGYWKKITMYRYTYPLTRLPSSPKLVYFWLSQKINFPASHKIANCFHCHVENYVTKEALQFIPLKNNPCESFQSHFKSQYQSVHPESDFNPTSNSNLFLRNHLFPGTSSLHSLNQEDKQLFFITYWTTIMFLTIYWVLHLIYLIKNLSIWSKILK